MEHTSHTMYTTRHIRGETGCGSATMALHWYGSGVACTSRDASGLTELSPKLIRREPSMDRRPVGLCGKSGLCCSDTKLRPAKPRPARVDKAALASPSGGQASWLKRDLSDSRRRCSSACTRSGRSRIAAGPATAAGRNVDARRSQLRVMADTARAMLALRRSHAPPGSCGP